MTLMAGKISFEKSIFDDLWHTFSACEGKILQCQKVCCDCKLLFQPWPVKGEEESGSQIAMDETASSSSGNSAIPERVSDPEVAEETLPDYVIEEINRADMLLAKAEKVVNQHLKKEENLVEKKRKPLTAVSKPNKPIPKRSVEPQSACISQSKLNHLLKKQQNSAPKAPKLTARPTSSKFKPAHMSAPFKTQPDINLKKRLKPGTRPGSAGLKSVEQLSGHTRPEMRVPSRNSRVLSRRENLESEQEPKTLVRCEAQNQVELWVENTSVEDSQSDPPVAIQAAKEENKAHQFCLLNEGSKLRVPSQLRRAAMQNKALQEKVNQASITRKVSAPTPSPKEEFMNQMQKSISSAYTSEQIEMMDLINFHCSANEKLVEMLESIPRTGIEHRDAKEICKLKKKVDCFRSQFKELDAVSASILEALPHYATPIIPTVDLRHDNHLRWLPCRPEHLTCSAIDVFSMKYSNREELLQWLTLHHEAQLLMHKSRLLDLLAPESFALLENCQEVELFTVYRGIHSLLCSLRGSEFPVLVSGDVGEDEESSDDS